MSRFWEYLRRTRFHKTTRVERWRLMREECRRASHQSARRRK